VNTKDQRDIEQLIALYDGEIRFMDERMMQPLLQRLEESGLLNNSIIVFTSDHGEEFKEHGRVRHEQVYDECLHVPLMFYLPEKLSGKFKRGEIASQVRLLDVMPTLLDLLDIESPTHVMQGRSLVPVFKDEEKGDRDVYATRIISSNRGRPYVRNYALRHGGHKLIRNVNYKHRLDIPWELYNLISDPGEMRNTMAEQPRLAERFRKALFRIVSQNKKTRETGGYKYRSARFKENSLEKLRALGYIQ
jgi:arylsulfatase A-like enzyme